MRISTFAGLMLLAMTAAAFAQQTPAAQKVPATAQKPAPGQDTPPADAVAPPPADDAGAADAAPPDQPEPIAFEGGQLTITQKEEYGEKTLAFDGKELASNYQLSLDRLVKLGDTNVALFDVGDGGNQCGPATVIVWKPEGGDIQATTVEQDECGSPPPAVTDSTIYFVPYLMPGGSKPALQWTPQAGLTTAGTLAFTPEPGTGWNDVDPSKYDNIIDSLHNEAVYKAALKVLGNRIVDVTTGLLVGGGTESTPSGVFYASGCVPHACGSADAFMAVDVKKHAVYFAQKGERPQPDSWPRLKNWPGDVRDAMKAALAPSN